MWCRRHHRSEQGESEHAHDKFDRKEVVILVNGHLMLSECDTSWELNF